MKTRTVRVLVNTGGSLRAETITISDNCSKCGKPRGEVTTHKATENRFRVRGSNRPGIEYDHWKNPCGHVDYGYELIEEAKQLQA